jgi:dephospho-CoA kinase
MGKSACAELLRAKKIPVVDTDDLAREVVQRGQPALAEIRAAFSDAVIGPDGQLRRGELARRVFADPLARQQLEAILHPRIRALWRAQVDAWRAEGHRVAAVVIPLLFETGAEKGLDATLCVACSAATQRERLQKRGWPPEQLRQRIEAQWPVDQKMALANYVIWSEGDLELHAAQLDRILAAIGS